MPTVLVVVVVVVTVPLRFMWMDGGRNVVVAMVEKDETLTVRYVLLTVTTNTHFNRSRCSMMIVED
jgi:hypothetical protein